MSKDYARGFDAETAAGLGLTAPTAEQVAAIADGLTKVQRETVVRWAGSHSEATDHALDPLWYCITKDAPNRFRLIPTSLGLAVRAHIIGASDHD